MSTLTDKLNYLNAIKGELKDAIVAKGVPVSDTDTFRSYADKISSIDTHESDLTEIETPWTPSMVKIPHLKENFNVVIY